MPWSHCGQPIPDDLCCPTCGRTNQSWELVAARTRVFSLSGRWEGDALGQARALVLAHENAAPFCET